MSISNLLYLHKKHNLRQMYVGVYVMAIVLSTHIDRSSGFKTNPKIVKEARLKPLDMIKYYGYQGESHIVTTEDGFKLEMHRIPGQKSSLYNKYGIPVLLMHGMNFQSYTWVNSGPNSFAFLLADRGYDVWMGNYRGTTFSQHSNCTRKQKEFWDYNFDDHVMKDLPTMIEYVLNVTGYEKLIHVGQSMGTSISFALFSETDAYNNKIAGNIALGPALTLKYSTAPPYRILKYFPLNIDIVKTIGSYTWLDTSDLMKELIFMSCPSDNPLICQLGMALMSGFDPYLPDKTRIPLYAVQSSSGVSINILIYIHQLINADKLLRFDHGPSKNMEYYKSATPPEYNFSRNVVPTVLFYGPNDMTTDPLDVVVCSRVLSNVIGMELIDNPMFAHGDYTWAANAKELVYDKALRYIEVWAHTF